MIIIIISGKIIYIFYPNDFIAPKNHIMQHVYYRIYLSSINLSGIVSALQDRLACDDSFTDSFTDLIHFTDSPEK